VIILSGGIDVLRIFLVLALLLSLLVTIFAVQNNTQTDISFLRWTATGSLALVLMVTVLIGIGIGVLFMLPGSVRARLAARAERKRNLQLESELAGLKHQAEHSSETTPENPGQAEHEEPGSTIA
jgi:uncharacterized integral membrane protein